MERLIDTGTAPGNLPEFTVSELSGAIRRSLEGGFAQVRVRGEIGRVSRPASGHVYLDLKDAQAVLAAVIWKGTLRALAVRPEEGLEVVATGRITTFPGQSKYQLVIESLGAAGLGALMALLEKRKAALAAEGLFDTARKQQIPFLPGVIGVVTSPTGAVIRDILHRLRDRFPREVIVWPVTVQGERCAAEVAAAIRGFNALAPGGPVPRPDLLIVARGGGSVEDLWGFNEEIVVRAAAESAIPLIAAVGHETDTTLIDLAADVRAPTPTAAAELAVPVRGELLAGLAGLGERRQRALARLLAERRQRLRDLGRLMPRPEALVAERAQRLDDLSQRLPRALAALVALRRGAFASRPAGRFGPATLALGLGRRREALLALAGRLQPLRLADRLRLLGERLGGLGVRLGRAASEDRRRRGERLDRSARLLQTLGYRATLARGYAVVRDGAGALLTDAAAARNAAALEIEFRDGRLAVAPPGRPAGGRARRGGTDPQGTLF
jgi:exodeoxyribonuclease VII large subunit